MAVPGASNPRPYQASIYTTGARPTDASKPGGNQRSTARRVPSDMVTCTDRSGVGGTANGLARASTSALCDRASSSAAVNSGSVGRERASNSATSVLAGSTPGSTSVASGAAQALERIRVRAAATQPLNGDGDF